MDDYMIKMIDSINDPFKGMYNPLEDMQSLMKRIDPYQDLASVMKSLDPSYGEIGITSAISKLNSTSSNDRLFNSLLDTGNVISQPYDYRSHFSDEIDRLKNSMTSSITDSLSIHQDKISNLMKEWEQPESGSIVSQVLSRESEAVKLFKSMDVFSKLKTETFNNLITNSFLSPTLSLHDSSAEKMMRNITSFSSFDALNKLVNVPLNDLLNKTHFDTYEDFYDDDLSYEDLIEKDEEISEELKNSKDYNLLSDKAKRQLSYIFHFYILPMLLAYFILFTTSNNDIKNIQSDIDIIKSTTQNLSKKLEIKTISKNLPIRLNRELLKEYRITKATKLHLITKPGIKYKSLALISEGTLVKVIDKSNKSWLFVEVEINGDIITGWIFRTHTIYFK